MTKVKTITKDTWIWKIASTISFFVAMVSLGSFMNNTGARPIAAIVIIVSIFFAIVFALGPKLKSEGRLNKSFLKTLILNLLRKQIITRVKLFVDGPVLIFDNKKTIMRKLTGRPSEPNTWAKLLEKMCYLNGKIKVVTLMEVVTTQSTVLEHKRICDEMTLNDPTSKGRRRKREYAKSLAEVDLQGTTPLIAETYEGDLPDRNLSQYGNISSVGIDPRGFLDIFRGKSVVLKTLHYTKALFNKKNEPVVFDFLGGKEPSIDNRYIKNIRVTYYDPLMNFDQLVDICRKYSAQLVVSLKPILPETALKTLENARNKQTYATKNDGGSEQHNDMEDERLVKIREFERRIRNGEHTYIVFVKISVIRNNTITLNNDTEAIEQELRLNGFETIIPVDQDRIITEIVTMSPGDEVYGFHMLANDLGKILSPLIKKSQLFSEPEGFCFGVAEYGERIIKDIEKLLSGGIGLVIGLTGTGKSYFLSGMMYFMSMLGYRVVVFDPKGAGMKDVSFTRMLNSVEGATAVPCESINIFDMFEDIETQKIYQRGALSILFKDISNDFVDIICQAANEFRENGIVPTFEIINKKFKEEIETIEEKETKKAILSSRSENHELTSLRKVIGYISPLTSEDRLKWFQTTPDGLRYPADRRVAADGFIGIDFSVITGDEFVKRAAINLVLFQIQIQMLQINKVPTILFIDEAHDVMAESDLLGNPTSGSIIQKFSNEGRSQGLILIGAAQMVKTLLKTDAGRYLFQNASWFLQLGRPDDKETLVDLGADKKDMEYLSRLTENEKGNGLFIVKGESPIQLKVNYPSFIHKMITGMKKVLKPDLNIGHVLRSSNVSKGDLQALTKRMGYRSFKHKEIGGEINEFLVKKANDPKLIIDLFLIQEYFKNQEIEIEVNYENGLIEMCDSETLIYVQSYDGSRSDVRKIIDELDELSEQWYIIFHNEAFVHSVMTDALQSKMIPRNEIPINMGKIIDTLE